MKEPRYSLNELAEQSGIEPRTIRSYIQKGLLTGPAARGRNAYYTDYHLNRLRSIKLLKEYYGLQMKEIREHLVANGDRELTPESSKQKVASSAGRSARPPGGTSSALDYIKLIKGQQVSVAIRQESRREPAPLWSPSRSSIVHLPEKSPGFPQKDLSPLEHLLRSLRKGLDNKDAIRSARGESWMHLDVTPDMKILVRGAYSPDELALLEKIADNMRELLLGGGRQE